MIKAPEFPDLPAIIPPKLEPIRAPDTSNYYLETWTNVFGIYKAEIDLAKAKVDAGILLNKALIDVYALELDLYAQKVAMLMQRD